MFFQWDLHAFYSVSYWCHFQTLSPAASRALFQTLSPPASRTLFQYPGPTGKPWEGEPQTWLPGSPQAPAEGQARMIINVKIIQSLPAVSLVKMYDVCYVQKPNTYQSLPFNTVSKTYNIYWILYPCCLFFIGLNMYIFKLIIELRECYIKIMSNVYVI